MVPQCLCRTWVWFCHVANPIRSGSVRFAAASRLKILQRSGWIYQKF